MLAALADADRKPRDAYMYRHLNVHGYWGFGGGKMSKSVGNVVEALALSEKYGNDAFRYFVMREMTFGLDASFSEEAFVARLNADLANDFGNLVARVTTLMGAHGGGIAVPWGAPRAAFTAREEEVQAAFASTQRAVDAAMEEFAFHRALAAVWEFIGCVNRYVDASAPWELAKDTEKRQRLEAVLAALGESLRCLGIMLSPFLPNTAKRVREALGEAGEPRLQEAVLGGSQRPVMVTASKLTGLFPRVDERQLLIEGAAVGPVKRDGAAPARVGLEDFAKIDLRVAQVVAAEAVPKSKKLLKLTVKMGSETRTLVAGIAEHYEPATLVGKKVVIVANLEPATLMGVRSDGMVLAAVEGSALALVTLDKDIPPGAKVK